MLFTFPKLCMLQITSVVDKKQTGKQENLHCSMTALLTEEELVIALIIESIISSSIFFLLFYWDGYILHRW